MISKEYLDSYFLTRDNAEQIIKTATERLLTEYNNINPVYGYESLYFHHIDEHWITYTGYYGHCSSCNENIEFELPTSYLYNKDWKNELEQELKRKEEEKKEKEREEKERNEELVLKFLKEDAQKRGYKLVKYD
jgi:RNA polymerase-binding transcription factor DksA